MLLEPAGRSSGLCSAVSLSSESPEVHRARGRAGVECPAARPLSKEESNPTRSTSASEYRLAAGRRHVCNDHVQTSPGQGVREGSVLLPLRCFLYGLSEKPACRVPTILQGGPGGHGGVIRQPGIGISGHSHQGCLYGPCPGHQQTPFCGVGHGPSVRYTIDHSPLLESLSSLGTRNPTLSRCHPLSLSLSLAVPSLPLPFPQPVPIP